MPKIAIFLHGQVRHLHESFPTQQDLFDGCEVDYYFHFWKPSQGLEIAQVGVFDARGTPDEEKAIQAIQPTNYVFEEQHDFVEETSAIIQELGLRVKPDYIFRVLSQYYSFSQFATVIPNIDDYDYILKTRTDLYFDTSQSLNYLFDHLNTCDVLVPYRDGLSPGDTCFFGTPAQFKKFAHLYEKLSQPQLYNDSRFFQGVPRNRRLPFSHVFLQWFFDHMNMSYCPAPFPHMIMRDYSAQIDTYEKMLKLYLKEYDSKTGEPRIQVKLGIQNNPTRKEFILNTIKQLHPTTFRSGWFTHL